MNEFDNILELARTKGIYPYSFFSVLVDRELKMASRFRYPVCFMRISMKGATSEQRQLLLELITKNTRTFIDLLSEYCDENVCYLLSPYSTLTISFIIIERIKLAIESVYPDWNLQINIAGVEVGKNNPHVNEKELKKYCNDIAEQIATEQGSGTRIYTLNELKDNF